MCVCIRTCLLAARGMGHKYRYGPSWSTHTSTFHHFHHSSLLHGILRRSRYEIRRRRQISSNPTKPKQACCSPCSLQSHLPFSPQPCLSKCEPEAHPSFPFRKTAPSPIHSHTHPNTAATAPSLATSLRPTSKPHTKSTTTTCPHPQARHSMLSGRAALSSAMVWTGV